MIAEHSTIHHARLRMAHYYARRIKQFNSTYLYGDAGYAFQQFREESDQIEQTLEWLTTHATEHEDIAYGFSAMLLNGHDLFSEYFSVKKQLALYSQLLQFAEAKADIPGMLICLVQIGYAYDMLNEHQQALKTHQHRITLARQIEDYVTLLHSMRFTALAYSEMGQKQEAERWVRKALKQSRQLKVIEEECWCLLYMGNLMIDDGKWDQAQHYLTDAHALVTRMRYVNPEQLLSLHKALGVLKIECSQAAASIPYLEQALTIAQSIGKHTRIVEVMHALAVGYDGLGDFAQARYYYDDALALAKAMNNRRWQAYLLNDMGTSYHLQENHETARDYLEESLSLWLDAENEHLACVIMVKLVFVYTALDMPEKARHWLQESIVITRRWGSNRLWAMVITGAVIFLVGTHSEPDMIQTAALWAGFVYQMSEAEHDTLEALDKARAQIIARIGQDAAERYLSQGARLHLDDLNNQLTEAFA